MPNCSQASNRLDPVLRYIGGKLKIGIKIHIAVVLIAATSAVVILSLLVIARNARSSAEKSVILPADLTLLGVDTNIPRARPDRSDVNR